ncbi:iron-sulfur protein [Dethiosulfatarculus sandiegensis]|uniref:Iron-sulfur protein n=1 Tax=Dethiosulfatarculus sandiegensis TaxID=1429043 RepID=A0A0D2JUW5_9BACT|nr:iron-sulfur protein [Dethiosulfatarculus sandiegensis]
MIKEAVMRILALNGSPTMKRGMTNILLDFFLKGAEDQGALVEKVFLQKKKIAPCLGCYSCWVKTKGVCVHKDDAPDLLRKMRKADYLILATPVYLDGMTAQMKAFMDRSIPLFKPQFEIKNGHCRHQRRYEKMPEVVLLSVAGFQEMDNFQGLVKHVELICRNWQTRFVGGLLRPTSYLLSMEELFPKTVGIIKGAAQRAGQDLVRKGSFDKEDLDAVAMNQFSAEQLVRQTNKYWERCIEAGRWPL